MAAAFAQLRSSALPVSSGDRLYALARWFVLLLLYIGALALNGLVLLSPSLSGAVSYVFWLHVALALVASAVVLLGRGQRLVAWSYLADIVLLAALSYLGPVEARNYLVLMLVPLIAAALRQGRVAVLGLSITAVLLAIVVLLRQGVIDALPFMSQIVLFGTLPALVNLLSDYWTADNRHQVQHAEQQTRQALAHAEAYRDRMRALYEVAVSLNTSGNATNVLEATLAECARFVPYQSGAIIVPTGVPDQVQVVAGRNLQAMELGASFRVATGTLATVLRGGDGGVLQNPHAEPELACLPSLTGCHTALILPLRSARRTFGLVIFGSQAAQIDVEQMAMATTLVTYGLTVLQNAQLVNELRMEREKLLAREEEVRKQLNRDLHDGPAQSLAAITMTLGFIKRLTQSDPQRVGAELDKLAAVAQRANHDVRTLLFELRPLVLETQGLLPTLRQYMERFELQNGAPRIVVEGDEQIGPVSKRVQGTLFNIVQESVNNALKHAQASHIWIRLDKQADQIMLSIQDDGKGFDLHAVKRSYDQRGSFGLLSLEERARLVGGSAELLSAPGAGTTVRVAVPFDASEL